MVWSFLPLLLSALLASSTQALTSREPLIGAQSVNLWKLNQLEADASTTFQHSDATQTYFHVDGNSKKKEFPDQWFEQPLDHFDSDNKHTWKQRYWVNKRHYKTGGPVIVLDGGETSGKNRIPFLDTGIVEILANATGGLGVVLEHRYYGPLI